MLNKKILRKKIISRRKNLSAEEINFLSHEIVKKFLATEIYKNSSTIMAYMSMPDEVQLREFFLTLLKRKKFARYLSYPSAE